MYNVCRYLMFSVAIAEENVAKPLQISAVVCPEGSERSEEVIFFLVIFSREIFHSIYENLIFPFRFFEKSEVGVNWKNRNTLLKQKAKRKGFKGREFLPFVCFVLLFSILLFLQTLHGLYNHKLLLHCV